MRSMGPVRRKAFLLEQRVVIRSDLEGLWDPSDRGSHAVVVAGVHGRRVIIKDTHYGSTVAVEDIGILVYEGHEV